MDILVIRTDGTEEQHTGKYEDIYKLIGAQCLDGVNLRDGRYMYVDDNGYEGVEFVETVEAGVVTFTGTGGTPRKPVNEKATKLYHSVCIAGTTHKIVGDVAIVPLDGRA